MRKARLCQSVGFLMQGGESFHCFRCVTLIDVQAGLGEWHQTANEKSVPWWKWSLIFLILKSKQFHICIITEKKMSNYFLSDFLSEYNFPILM